MILSDQKAIELIENGVSDRINKARKRAKKINMHITGKNIVEYLKRLEDYETTGQKNLREKLVKSNRSVFSFILRPIDKVFTAKGGSINYNLPSQTVSFINEQISDVADGLDIKKYLKKVVRKNYIIDPNGILFVDIDPMGMLETHTIGTDKILWYENKGNRIDAIIFEGQERDGKENKGKKFYRVIDERSDRIFVNEGGKVGIVLEETIDNFFGYVPAIILGDEKDPNEDIFESIVADIIDDADILLRRMSVMNVHELAHLMPMYWQYAQACVRCGGEGEIINEQDERVTCPSCGGDGEKKRLNASDVITLQKPEEGETVIAPNIGGFIEPNLETAKFYIETIDNSKNSMFQATWGTTYEGGGKRETATGRFLDAQPVQDRLRDISDTFAKYHKFLLDAYIKVLLNNKNYESSVSYGGRYILENPDDILKLYTEATKMDISSIVELDLLYRYIEAEYQSDDIGMAKRKKLARIEPFPTNTITELTKIEGFPQQSLIEKAHFGGWVNTLTDAQVIFSTESELRTNFNEYIINLNTNTDE